MKQALAVSRGRISRARSSGLAHAVEYAPQDARPARRSDRCAAPRSARPRRPRGRAEKPAAKKSECFALQAFGDWKGVATNTQAGARIGQISFADADSCDLRGEISVADSYDAKLVLYGDPDGTPLPKDFLVKPENRLIAKNEDGSIAVDEPLCGVCTGIRDDKVSIVLPLSTGALFRAAKSVEMSVKLGDAKACGFTLDCEDLRKALDWAKEKKEALAKSFEDDKCAPPAKGCFLTTACCEVLGLPDDCFELRTLRRYRDESLAAMPGGNAAIAAYYLVAPSILDRLSRKIARRAFFLSMRVSSCRAPLRRGLDSTLSPIVSMLG